MWRLIFTYEFLKIKKTSHMNCLTCNKFSHVRALNCEDYKLLVVLYFCYEC